MKDMAEHHHQRKNQNRLDNPVFDLLIKMAPALCKEKASGTASIVCEELNMVKYSGYLAMSVPMP